MKLLKILGKYQKGVRLSSLFLIILMSWSIFQGVFVYARYQNQISDTAVFESAESDNAYYLQFFMTPQSFTSELDLDAAEKAMEKLRNNPAVAHIFTIRYASPVTYGGTSSGVLLYEPEMVNFFPGFKSIGIDFSKNPDGCILGSTLFSDLHTGDQIELTFNQGGGKRETASFDIAGKLSNPYSCMRFTTSSSVLKAKDLFNLAGDVVIMQATDTVMAQLETLARRIDIESNFVVVFREGISVGDQEVILNEAAPIHVPFSFDRILQNTIPFLRSQLSQALVQPLFFAVASLIAYLSLLILTFKKKEKEMAVWYLCGGSEIKCGLITFVFFSVLALIPVLLTTALVLYWPSINWSALHNYVYIKNGAALQEFLGQKYYFRLLGLIYGFKDLWKIDSGCLSVIFCYYGASVLIALGATVGSMRKHSPLTYLRGVGK